MAARRRAARILDEATNGPRDEAEKPVARPKRGKGARVGKGKSKGSNEKSKGSRPKRCSAAESERRVRRIVGLMTEFKWQPGRTSLELADEWGCSEQNVSRLAAEASRHIRAAYGDPEEVRARFVQKLELIGDLATNGEKELLDRAGNPVRVSSPDYRSAVYAHEAASKLLGLEKTQVELSGKLDVSALLAMGIAADGSETESGEADDPLGLSFEEDD